MIKTIDEYLDSLSSEISIKLRSTRFIDEVKEFCKKNESNLNELPSTSQLEQLKLISNPGNLIKYIIDQSEKSTNKKWRTKVLYRGKNCPFFEFLIDRIFTINEPEALKYFIEYFTDFLKMGRK